MPGLSNTIAALTGTFDYYGSDAMEGGFVNDGANVCFSLGETITFGQPQCDQWGDCTIPFSGRPLGGSMVASFQNNTTITLTPFDMTGSISGVLYTTDWAESGCMQVDSYSFSRSVVERLAKYCQRSRHFQLLRLRDYGRSDHRYAKLTTSAVANSCHEQ